MTQQLGPTIEILLSRIRQDGGFAIDPDLAIEIYTRCEQVINATFKNVLVENANLTIPKEKLLFSLRDEFSDAAEIISISKSNRDIFKCVSFVDFSSYEIDWFRSVVGTRFEAWMPIGRDLFILYPGQAAASSVSVTYVKLLTVYKDFDVYYNTDSDLEDEDVDVAIDLAELVLLTRYRQLSFLKSRAESFGRTLKQRGVII